MVRPSVRPRRSRAFRPAEITVSFLEARKLLTTFATIGPLAYQHSPDQITMLSQYQAQPVHEAYILDPANNAEEADPSYGGSTASPAENLQQAINLIANSQFGQGDLGKSLVQTLKNDQTNGKIAWNPTLPKGTVAQYDPNTGNISLNPGYVNDQGSLATALVHEGSHQTYDARNPGSNDPNNPNFDPKYDLNDEVDSFQHELDFYRQLPAGSLPEPGSYRTDLDNLVQQTPYQLRQTISQRYGYY